MKVELPSYADIRKLILEIIEYVDYDTAKFYNPETSENPDEAERELDFLVDLFCKRITGL